MWRRLAGLTLSLLIGLCPGLTFGGEDGAGGKINVFVGIEPIAYFVERVGGPLVDVSVLVGPGQDPHTFEPTPKLMAKLARAKLFFNLGFPFEETLVKKLGATFKNAEIVNIQKGIKLRPVNEQDGDNHAVEEHGHAHEADSLDRHTWLDPQLARIQAGTIADALIQVDPENRQSVRSESKEIPGRSGQDSRTAQRSVGACQRQELLRVSPGVWVFCIRIRVETGCSGN